MAEYKPGVCNIGKKEVRRRYALAIVGFLASALAAYIIVSLHLPRWSLLISFIPLVFAFEGLYQGYFRFCAGFAAKGIYDFTGSGGSRKLVDDLKDHYKDVSKAKRIHIYSILSAVVVVALIYLFI